MKTVSEETICIRIGRVAEMLDCSESKVYSLIKDGHLIAIRLSGGKKAGMRVLSSSLKDFLHKGGVKSIRELTPAERVNAQRPKYRRSSREWF